MSANRPAGLIGTSVTPSGASGTDTASGMWSLEEALYWKSQGKWPTSSIGPTIAGQEWGGGYYAGQISTSADGVATHYLIVAPVATGQTSHPWRRVFVGDVPGATSLIDGPGNTAAILALPDADQFLAAQFCANLTIGGFTDWYLPARDELEICFYNLKPTLPFNNNTGSGGNAYSVPPRASRYTTSDPSISVSTDFWTGSSEAFVTGNFWSSTQVGESTAYTQYFPTGSQSGLNKITSVYVRAVRRIPV